MIGAIVGAAVAVAALVALVYLLGKAQAQLDTTIRLFETALEAQATQAATERRELASRIQAPDVLPLPDLGESPGAIGFENDDEYWAAQDEGPSIENE